LIIALAVAALLVPTADALAIHRLVSREEARRLGLERAWFAQVQLDRARSHVVRAILTGDRLTVLTSAGVVHELDALTGETLWSAPVGNPDYPSLGPDADSKHVAVVNGSTLYVLRADDGRPVIDRQVGGGPGAGPAVAEEYVFVPLISGRIEGYPLNQGEDKTHTPWYYQSYGRAMVQPLATPESFAWSTDMGRFYVGESLTPSVRFRLETRSDIIAPPAYHKPLFYVGTAAGDLFALDETSGSRRWKFTTGYPIVRAPAAVADLVYVTTEEPAMHCVDAHTGAGRWQAPKLTQFAAASRERVYGIDDLAALVVLDAKTGALLDRMPTDGTASALVNDQTDRLYLVSDDGLIQCLHEIGAKTPLDHNPAPAAAPPATSPATEAAPSETSPSTSDEGETAPPEATLPATEDENPFGPPAAEGAGDETDQPADAPDQPATESEFGVDDANPFGF
jgi:hypothetical protein